MTRRVYKYKIDNATGFAEVTALAPSRVVRFASQHGQFCLWVEVDPDGAAMKTQFQIFGTGHDIPADADWVASCDSNNQDYIWHLYQLSKWEPVAQ